MKRIYFYLFIFVLLLNPLYSTELSPVGKWKTISDETGKETGILEIKEENGFITAKIIELLDANPPNPICTKCIGKQKNQPVIGLAIITGLKKSKDAFWSGGEILDPKSGKFYKCFIEVLDNGNTLKVRGYIGFSLLGRTQYWYRK